MKFKKMLSGGFLLLAVLTVTGLLSCNRSAGIKKDLNTGLTSTYKNLAPEKVFLMMNGETLNNNNIPLGEKFLVINENVNGFKEKEGKVSIGCALKITDAAGKSLLDEQDLFSGEDIFKPEDAAMLRCTVTTGSPMEPNQKYAVHVKFWDKYGDGVIENKLDINAVK